jgi:hypothetical protein
LALKPKCIKDHFVLQHNCVQLDPANSSSFNASDFLLAQELIPSLTLEPRPVTKILIMQ